MPIIVAALVILILAPTVIGMLGAVLTSIVAMVGMVMMVGLGIAGMVGVVALFSIVTMGAPKLVELYQIRQGRAPIAALPPCECQVDPLRPVHRVSDRKTLAR